MIRVAVVAGVLLAQGYVYYELGSERVVPVRETFADFPRELGAWRCDTPGEIGEKVVRNLGVSDYLLCDYARDGDQANVYVGYHASQVREEGGGGNENAIHPPRHCLPGSGWDIIRSEQVDFDAPALPERPARVNRLLIAKGEARRLVFYWYQSRGRVIADDWRKIVFMSYDRGTRGRTDGSLVRLTIPVRRGDEARAQAAFDDIAPRLVAQLAPYVPE